MAWAPRMALLIVLLLSGGSALAQGCAMCKANADALSEKGKHALNQAILVMVLPPVAIMLLGARAAWRYSRKRDADSKVKSEVV